MNSLSDQQACGVMEFDVRSVPRPQIFKALPWRQRSLNHKRSQGGPKGPCPPQFLENIALVYKKTFFELFQICELILNVSRLLN